ncbi:MAG TPA: head decoration protein [Rhizomicrobium sp.]|jgi:hypothetical protein
MTTLTEDPHAGGHLVSEGPGNFCREQITVASGADLVAGRVLGRITIGAQTVHAAVAFAGNTGNGTLGSLTGDAGALAGDWKVVIVEKATNAGAFEVLKPNGTLDGTGNVGVAYNGGINFPLADGAIDFVAGDGFTISVTYATGSLKYVGHDATATDGSQNACALLYGPAFAATADVQATAHVRGPVEYNASEVTWKTGISDNDKNAGIAALAALGLVGR